MLLGLILRLWFISVSGLDPRFSGSDDGDYYQRALRMVTTGAYVDNSWLIRPPGHVFFFAAMLQLGLWFDNPELGITLIRGVQVVLSLLLIPVGYDLARRLFEHKAGLIFAAFLTVWLPLVELPMQLLSEPLFFTLLVLSCWALVRWRDQRTWRWLVAAGSALGAAALARSPALYAAVFGMLFILWETHPTPLRPLRTALPVWLRQSSIAALLFLLPIVAFVGPWTLRNYALYGQMILIDNTGPVNLWLSLQDERIDGGKSVLAGMDQVERHLFVRADTQRILSEEPWRLTRNVWPHFTHIWKLQFVEDFFVKVSFFGRPLREILLLGVLSDLIWLGFTLTSVFALTRYPHEGGFRLIALGWIAYSCLTVMLIHVEPRYLLPVWFFMALYASASSARVLNWLALRRRDWGAATRAARRYFRSPWGFSGIALCLTLIMLIVSYRDYPQIIARGWQREVERSAALRAVAAGDYAEAIAAYQRMREVAPLFVDGRSELALIYLKLGEYDRAWEAVGTRHTYRSELVRGAIARAQGLHDLAANYFEEAEVLAAEDVQRLTLAWLPNPPVQTLSLGNGLDFGYIEGFSFGERLFAEGGDPPPSFRWLQAQGRISLPLPTALPEGASVRLRMAGPGPGPTPLRVSMGSTVTTIMVQEGGWRLYRIAVPHELVGTERLELSLAAPTFIPFRRDAASIDARALSIKVSHVAVE
ncbi:hypothetical protein CJ255_03945 [Candidatus Viridilinea mediisalina]|uniref:Glycosyltransferase RgtA/B/C/D-like domain-containing protein n=2 Tax=Candidatus Viridilinea mediisalina TaxID=2024553 RepID=A0A2A6RN62_9CHLR|nr:hypothetical protein CJ255_03945 [Candidatus Viridilinea mediisalina]